MNQKLITIFVVFICYANAIGDVKMNYLMQKEITNGFSVTLNDTDSETLSIDKEYMNIELAYIENILKNNHFIFPSKEVFEHKINELFHLNSNNHTTLLYAKQCTVDKNPHYFPSIYFDGGEGVVLISQDKRFLLHNIYRLPDILNYQKVYPKLRDREEKVKTKIFDAELNVSGTITLWKEIYQTKKEYQKYIDSNIEYIIRLNKYLFNHNENQMKWLVKHSDFLKKLVVNYGYSKDEKLLSLLLEEGLKNSDLNGLLWYTICTQEYTLDNEVQPIVILHINQEIFNIISLKIGKKKFNKVEDNPYLNLLSETMKSMESTQLSQKEQISIKYYIRKFIDRYLAKSNN